MPQYRFIPTRVGKLWCAILGVAALLLALPTLLNLVVPDRPDGVDGIRLGSLGYAWEIPLRDSAGEIISCRKSSDVITGYLWDCEGTMVQSMIIAGSEDEEQTLRRMMRALIIEYPPANAPVFREEAARMVIDPRYGAVGMSLAGTDDQAGQSMITLVYGGTEVPELADAVWFHYSQQSLPTPVLMLLEGMAPAPIDSGLGLTVEPQTEDV